MSFEHPSTGYAIVGFALGTIGAIAVFLHADKNGSKHPTAWGFLTFLFVGIMVPVYAIHVRRTRRRRNA